MSSEPGRNDPCPCGSGRKYKHCCLGANEASDFLWRQARAAEGRSVPELLQLALDEFGKEFYAAALDEFFLWDGAPEDYNQTEEFSSFFVPWFVYEFVADPNHPDRVENAPDESLAALYVRRRGDRVSSTERAFLTSASTSPLTFYSVTRVVAGREMALHNILIGGDVVVRERSASQMVRPGALLFTRVVTAGEISIMSGLAPLVIPPRWHHTVLDFRERYAPAKGQTLTMEFVRDLDIELRELYFYIEDELWNPRLPELRNTDGDKLVLTTLTYRLRCTPASAFERLRPLARASNRDVTELLSDATMSGSGELEAVRLPWNKKGNRMMAEWDNTTLGTIEINRERLEVHVNSARRATRIAREIAKRLGADALLERKTKDPDREAACRAEGSATRSDCRRRTRPAAATAGSPGPHASDGRAALGSLARCAPAGAREQHAAGGRANAGWTRTARRAVRGIRVGNRARAERHVAGRTGTARAAWVTVGIEGGGYHLSHHRCYNEP